MLKWFAFSWSSHRHLQLLRLTRMISEETAPLAKRLCTEDREYSEPIEHVTEKAQEDDTAAESKVRSITCFCYRCKLMTVTILGA